MEKIRAIHPNFQKYLASKDQDLIDLYTDLRIFILYLYPDSNELLYRTHALTSLYTVSGKMSDGFCMIPIYTNHLNLGFSKGAILEDPHLLLKGSGKLIRHIPISNSDDYRNDQVKALLTASYDLAIEDRSEESNVKGETISKIKH